MKLPASRLSVLALSALLPLALLLPAFAPQAELSDVMGQMKGKLKALTVALAAKDEPASLEVLGAMQVLALEAKGFYDWGGEWEVKGGYAQGDSSPLSSKITQYGFRPDYQIALLMFNYPLGTSPTLRNATTGARLTGGVPITGNMINNAYYGTATYMHNIDIRRAVPQANYFKVGLRGVTAWADKSPVSLNFA